ncbi:hypothetical protein TNCV_634271 [Trichonephila clavipes]|nr:hypothetical protein TNCV_634271 [Trichonephila clavipes]
MCGLSLINNIRDQAFSEIWILTDSQSSIQHFLELAIYRRQHQQENTTPFSIAFRSAPYPVGPFSCRPAREQVADILAKEATSDPVVREDHMVLTSTEIYSRTKELIYRTWVVPPVHPWTSTTPSIVPEFLRFTSCKMTTARGHGAIVYCLNSGSEDGQTGRHNGKVEPLPH